MAKKLVRILNSIASAFVSSKKKKTVNKSSDQLKLFTFMIKGQGIRKSVNIKAADKSSAEKKIHAQYPGCTADFLWELIRSPQ